MLTELNKEIEALKVGERLVKAGVPDTVYHLSTGIGSTAMKAATKSMAHYHHYKTTPHNDTPDTIIGSAVHTMVLEPDLFFDRFMVEPEAIRALDRRTKKYQDWKKAQRLPILTDDAMATVYGCSNSIMNCAGAYFFDGEPEKSYWYRHSSGLVLKARIDYELGDLSIDLKTTRHENRHRFLNAVRYDYDIQDALYRRITGLKLLFIAVSKDAPHPVFAVEQGPKGRDAANTLIDETIDKILFAEQFDDFSLPALQIISTE